MSRSDLRRLAAALCAGIAGVYVLIGLEVVHVGDQADGSGDIRVFGFGAATIFLVGMVMLLAVDVRPLWALGAVLQAMIVAMYFGASADRDPSFEAWGLSLRLPQLVLLGVLVYLAMRPTESGADQVVDRSVVEEFLAQHRFAVVGASDEAANFGRTVMAALDEHGYDVVAVHPSASSVAGRPAFPSLAAVPGPLDGVIVMVPRSVAPVVVRDAVDRGVPRVWLFRGAGAGAVSAEAIDIARDAGARLVPGACPLMFLPPVTGVHRIHRGIRQLNRSVGAPT